MTEPTVLPNASASQGSTTSRVLGAFIAHSDMALLACFSAKSQTCLDASTAFAMLFGLTPKTIMGRHLAQVFAPDDLALVEHFMRLAGDHGQEQQFELSLRTDDGGVRDFDVSLLPYAHPAGTLELCLGLHEVTRFRAMARMAHEAAARLHRFMDASTEGIVFQRDGVIVDMNPALARLMGHADQELIGRRAIDFVSPDYRDIVIGKFRDKIENSPYEVTLLHREGYDIPVELISRNIEFDGEILRMTLVRDIRARRAAESRIRELAERDGLTGLYNRRVLLEQLPTRIAGLAESEQTAALLFIDLDRFKQVNDRHGHAQGDRLLQAVGRVLLGFLTPGDIAGRMGGDEFAMLLTGVQPEAALHRAQALLARLQTAFDAAGLVDLAYASIGVALFPNHAQTADTLRRQADQAMYLAKAQGGNAVRLYAPAG
jgi:diguanylate cyclase (GGDEF)-like protein/PAS domain S-box-containing protein